MRDAAAALLQQVARGLKGTVAVVEHHRIDLLAGQEAVEKHQRHAPAAHLVEVVVVLGAAGQRHQHAGHLGSEQRFDVAALQLHVFGRLAHDDAKAGLAGGLLNALNHRGKELTFDVRHHYSQQAALALAQGGGEVVGLVIALPGQLEHALLGGGPNAVVVAERPRNSRHRHAQLAGQVGHRNGGRGRARRCFLGEPMRGKVGRQPGPTGAGGQM